MSSAIRGRQLFHRAPMAVDVPFVTTKKSFRDTMIWQPLALPPLNTGTTRRTSTLRLKKLLGVARRLSGGEMMQAAPTRRKYLILSIGSKEKPNGELASYRSWGSQPHFGGAYNPARRQNKRDRSLLQSEKWPAVGCYLPLSRRRWSV